MQDWFLLFWRKKSTKWHSHQKFNWWFLLEWLNAVRCYMFIRCLLQNVLSSDSSATSGGSPGVASPASLKSEAMDDVLEILIRTGGLCLHCLLPGRFFLRRAVRSQDKTKSPRHHCGRGPLLDPSPHSQAPEFPFMPVGCSNWRPSRLHSRLFLVSFRGKQTGTKKNTTSEKKLMFSGWRRKNLFQTFTASVLFLGGMRALS